LISLQSFLTRKPQRSSSASGLFATLLARTLPDSRTLAPIFICRSAIDGYESRNRRDDTLWKGWKGAATEASCGARSSPQLWVSTPPRQIAWQKFDLRGPSDGSWHRASPPRCLVALSADLGFSPEHAPKTFAELGRSRRFSPMPRTLVQPLPSTSMRSTTKPTWQSVNRCARNGETSQFHGYPVTYEPQLAPELTVQTDSLNVSACAPKIVKYEKCRFPVGKNTLI
jgi:hypothetical protein